jgi:hypothetical protein
LYGSADDEIPFLRHGATQIRHQRTHGIHH